MTLPRCRRRITLGPDRHNCTALQDNTIIVSDAGCQRCQEVNGVNPWFLFKQYVQDALYPPIPIYSKKRRGPTIPQMAWSLAVALGRYFWRGGRLVSPVAYQQRRAACATCDNKKGSRCGLCGCFLPVKLAFPSESCPDDPPRWVATIKESEPSPSSGGLRMDPPICGCKSTPDRSESLPIIPGE